ncbi:hypothetical protein H4582DRAFT_194206 [Lactarius indigo]|nr:hypothetical protein H4582DRAFT_194206 [Lactarius indigo]
MCDPAGLSVQAFELQASPTGHPSRSSQPSFTSALSATLMQRWARRYPALSQRRGASHKRARMRASYIYDDVQRFGMSRTVETIPTLLSVSVFLFFICDFNSFTELVLQLPVSHALIWIHLAFIPGFPVFRAQNLSTILGIEVLFHEPLLELWPRKSGQNPSRVLSDGLRRSVERSATSAPSAMDASALEWTLTSLDEDEEIEDFAARVSRVFESDVVSDVPSTILSLLSDQPTTDPIPGSRLHDLLQTCRPGVERLTE